MYVHLGGDLIVAVMDVVAVLDARLVAGSAINEEFIRQAQASGHLRGEEAVGESKSVVVTRDRAVYVSGISPATLTRRMTHLRQSLRAWDAES